MFERSELGGALTVPFFPGIRVPSGRLFFGDFLLAKQKKVTRPAGETAIKNHHPRSGFNKRLRPALAAVSNMPLT